MGEFGELPNVPDLTVDEAQKKQEEGGNLNAFWKSLVLISAHHISSLLLHAGIPHCNTYANFILEHTDEISEDFPDLCTLCNIS